MVDALREYYPGVLGSMLLLEKPWFKSGLYNLARHWLSDTVSRNGVGFWLDGRWHRTRRRPC